MNRRSFLKFLSAIPVIRNIPLPRRLVYGCGNDGDVVLLGNKWVSPHTAIKMMGGGGAGGDGFPGGLIVVFPQDAARTIILTAKGDKDVTLKPGVETADLKEPGV